MILATPQLLENFDAQNQQGTSTTMISEQLEESLGLSQCKDGNNEKEAFNNIIAFETDVTSNAELNLDTLEMVTLFENLEPGMYMLDVFQSTDYYVDSVLTDSSMSSDSNSFIKKLNPVASNTTSDNVVDINLKDETMTKKLKSHYKGIKKPYQVKSCKDSNCKPLSQKYELQTRDVTACEFLNNFSNNLADEGTSLTWLLNFEVSSIWHSNNCDDDVSEGIKKKQKNLQKKPRYTYTELIEQALKENGKLTVSGIYNWISNHYPYYQQHDDRWKNSVRHNLSINPQFQKGKKALQGAGHFWNISENVSQTLVLDNYNESNYRIEANAPSSPFINLEPKNRIEDVAELNPDSVKNLVDQFDERVLTTSDKILENENISFADVSLDGRTPYLHSGSNLPVSKNNIERLLAPKNERINNRLSSLSPLICEITEEYAILGEGNFYTQDVQHCIYSEDNSFLSGELDSTCEEWFSKTGPVNS